MARIIFPDGKEIKDLPAVQSRLARLGITLRSWPAPAQTRDMVVIHEDIPGLADMLAKFDKIHTHSDDEVRYILAGTGYFGFVEADGKQFLLEVSGGDYINVPANAEHWFEMRGCTRCKAVPYFIDPSGWTPHYTGRRREIAEAAATA